MMYYINNKTNKITKATKYTNGYIVETDHELFPIDSGTFEEMYTLISADELTDKIQAIKEIRDIQGQPGNIDYSNYMVGMYNGLELALAILEGNEPQYKPCMPEETAEARDEFINSILSCFSNNDLQKHLELRKATMRADKVESKYLDAEQLSDSINDLETCNGLDIFFDEQIQKEQVTEKLINKSFSEEDKNKYFG